MLDAPNEMMEGVEITNEKEHSQPLFTHDEKRILEVYDRLEELQFEIALLKAQGVLSSQGARSDPIQISNSNRFR